MFEDGLDSAMNLKQIMCIFEQLSRLKVNFHKSEYYFGIAKKKYWNIPLYLFVLWGNPF